MSVITPIPTKLTKEHRLEFSMLVGHHLALAFSYNQLASNTWIPWTRRKHLVKAREATAMAAELLEDYRNIWKSMT